MADWELVKGTLDYDQQFDVEEPEGTAKVLSGFTNYLIVWKKGSTTYLFKTQCGDVDLSAGEGKYTTNSTDDDLLTKGPYLFSILCTKDSDSLPTKPLILEVLEGPPTS